MSKKRTTLHSTAIAECKSLSSATSTIDVALNHNAPTVGQPTGQTPNMFSIVDTTEKVVELDIVDNTLLVSQRNTVKNRNCRVENDSRCRKLDNLGERTSMRVQNRAWLQLMCCTLLTTLIPNFGRGV